MVFAPDTSLISPRPRPGLRTRLMRVIARPGFQRWASAFPLTRRTATKDGAALFDLVQGFVKSQVLFALVELRVLHRLMEGPQAAAALAQTSDLSVDKMERLLMAATALKLTTRDRKGRYGIARLGAAVMGVPGLEDMIRHHTAFYRDLSDPVALLRGDVDSALSAFWPYVFGAAQASDPEMAHRYSNLMAQSQQIVAADTLAVVDLGSARHLLDVGGGYGTFAETAVLKHHKLRATVFDLPALAENANAVMQASRAQERLHFSPGSFRDDALPGGADTISLIRVLYDHEDSTVEPLLKKAFDRLPRGGRLIVSEPMSGGAQPDLAGDVYFSFYCLAMKTGTVRSAHRIAEMCAKVGFDRITPRKSRRPYVTCVLTAEKPA